jgi:uroporphyrinogen decarboxylase
MRQAGRSDPVYREIREAFPASLEELFRNPELAAMISLLPVRWGVDAVIIYQDILTPLQGMGAPFVFRPGPQPETPFREIADFNRLRRFDMTYGLPAMSRLYKFLVGALKVTDIPLLGFAGAPFTLFAFMAENGSPPADMPNTRVLMTEHPKETRRILKLLADMTVDYLKFQIMKAQMRCSCLNRWDIYCLQHEYAEWMLPYQQQVFDGINGTGKPTIFFAQRHDTLLSRPLLQASGATILSLPRGYSIKAVRAELGAKTIIQGNLDNHLLVDGDEEGDTGKRPPACIEEGGCRGHIFNLSHGLLPQYAFENVRLLVETVRGYGKGT